MTGLKRDVEHPNFKKVDLTNKQQINNLQKEEQKEEKNKLTQKQQKPFTATGKD